MDHHDDIQRLKALKISERGVELVRESKARNNKSAA
jgi:hypothetical protein